MAVSSSGNSSARACARATWRAACSAADAAALPLERQRAHHICNMRLCHCTPGTISTVFMAPASMHGIRCLHVIACQEAISVLCTLCWDARIQHSMAQLMSCESSQMLCHGLYATASSSTLQALLGGSLTAGEAQGSDGRLKL